MNPLIIARKESGNTSTKVAAYVGVTEQTITRWEKMNDLTKLRYCDLVRLSQFYEKSIDFFIKSND